MRAPAKVNLMLHATARRADGYHLLQSLVMFADMGDDLSFTPADDFALSVSGEFAGALDDDNLINKAAHALAASHGIDARGHLSLVKSLPVGAGLGGGSADAAAALKLLSEAWGCAIGDTLPATLGSDVPACLHNAPLWMEGVGERITPVRMAFDIPALLVNPRRAVSTQAVYRRLAPPFADAALLPTGFDSQAALTAWLRGTHNALQAPSIALEPLIQPLLDSLAATDGCELARMSGSGATCFGLFASAEQASAGASQLLAAHPGWWVRPVLLKGSQHVAA